MAEKGKIIFLDDKPLVLCRGLFVKLADFSFKLEHVQPDTLKEIVRIAARKPKSEHHAILEINALGETHCFWVHRGVSYESAALFEMELNKI